MFGQGLVMFGNGEHKLADSLLDTDIALKSNNMAREVARDIVTRFDNSQFLKSNSENCNDTDFNIVRSLEPFSNNIYSRLKN